MPQKALRKKLIALNAYTRKEASLISNLSFHLKEPEKEDTKTKQRQKEIIKKNKLITLRTTKQQRKSIKLKT